MLIFLLMLLLFAIIDTCLYHVFREYSDNSYYLLPGGGILKCIVSLCKRT
jgi:hypothetical protein